MTQPRNCIAIKFFLFLLSLLVAASAWAVDAVGTVINLNGPLLARKADGTAKILAARSSVFSGDTLVTDNGTYARVRFVDNSEITLRPNSQFKIENFSFDKARPAADDAKFNLVKGGLRAVTGTIGKRNPDSIGFTTPTATIGVRGTTFIAEYVAPTGTGLAYARASLAEAAGAGTRSDAPVPFPSQPLELAQNTLLAQGRAPGLYVQVLDGVINLSNGAGSKDVTAGQFGYAARLDVPPVLLPTNPGMEFNPPPGYISEGGGGGGGAGSEEGVDCEVR